VGDLVRDIRITYETFAIHPVTNQIFQLPPRLDMSNIIIGPIKFQNAETYRSAVSGAKMFRPPRRQSAKEMFPI